MAKTAPKPSESEDGEGSAKSSGKAAGKAAGKSGGKKKLVVAIAAVLLLGGGGAGWFLFGGKGHGHEASADKAEEKKPVAFLDVQEMIVNLASDQSQDKPRFLRLKVALELKDGKAVPEVQPLLPRVVDIVQVFTRELRASDLEGSGGIYRLREELLRRVNIAVYPTKVDAVLFKEVVIQ